MFLSKYSVNISQRQEAGLQFYSELISYSPLTAILTTTAHPALDGAKVICETLASMGTLTIRIVETGTKCLVGLYSLHMYLNH